MSDQMGVSEDAGRRRDSLGLPMLLQSQMLGNASSWLDSQQSEGLSKYAGLLLKAREAAPGSAEDSLLSPTMNVESVQKAFDGVAGNIKARVKRVAVWRESFNGLVSDPFGLALFERYLRGECSEENIMFWRAVGALQRCHKKGVARSIILEIVTEIYDIFINESPHVDSAASFAINVTASVRDNLERLYASRDITTFDAAAEAVFSLMQHDPYSRFLRSDILARAEMGERKRDKSMRKKQAVETSMRRANTLTTQDKQTSNIARLKIARTRSDDAQALRKRSPLAPTTSSTTTRSPAHTLTSVVITAPSPLSPPDSTPTRSHSASAVLDDSTAALSLVAGTSTSNSLPSSPTSVKRAVSDTSGGRRGGIFSSLKALLGRKRSETRSASSE